MSEYEHIPVLLEEAIEGLNIKPDGIYVDATLGGAGHSSAILKKLSKDGHLYCIDQDQFAIDYSKNKLKAISNQFTIIKSNFVNIDEALKSVGVDKVDGILYDLGVSSFQFDDGSRGFSYNVDAKLDMRMDDEIDASAYDIVNYCSFNQLKEILFKYGEEKYGANIAKRIVHEREKKPIETTFELSEIVKKAYPSFARRDSHPAKKTFQAIRIFVNNELENLSNSLKQALNLLNSKGRVVVISFHSLEDRIVKNTFKSMTETNIPKDLPIKASEIKKEWEIITKHCVIPTKEEIERNNRSHSAKMRIIEKI